MTELNEIIVEEKRENDKIRMNILIDKEEHDKKCQRYSTYSFLFGIACIMLYGILNIK